MSTSTEEELGAIIRAAAEPIQPGARSQFYAAVERRLCWRELTPELVGAVCAEVQREFVVPPDGWPTMDGRR